MARCRHILPRIKEAFEYLKDVADHNPMMLDRDMLCHVFVQYELDKIWRNDNGHSYRK